MSDLETKDRHSRRRKRNFIAKILRDPGDMKGAFSLRVVNPKKGQYKREKIDARTIKDYEDE